MCRRRRGGRHPARRGRPCGAGTARSFARALLEDDELDDPELLPGLTRAGALAGLESLPEEPVVSAPAGGEAAPARAADTALYGAGLGLGFRITPDASFSASYRLRKPYTGQSDIDYLKFKPGADKQDISLDFRYRF